MFLGASSLSYREVKDVSWGPQGATGWLGSRSKCMILVHLNHRSPTFTTFVTAGVQVAQVSWI